MFGLWKQYYKYNKINHFGKYCKTMYNLNTVRSNISNINVEISEVRDDDVLFVGVIDKGGCKFRAVITVSFYENNKQIEFKFKLIILQTSTI